MNEAQPFKRVAIIGVGLIGGSLARALRLQDDSTKFVGCGRDLAHLQQAQALGVVDEITSDAAQAVAGADLVFLSVPVGAMADVFRKIKNSLQADAIITDGGSTKASVINAAREAFGDVPANFVPGHPVAGTEQSGVAASFAELFQQRRVILTPTETTNKQALARVVALWQAVGAQVTQMPAEHHDEVLAATSHLPHVLAYALVDALAGMQERREIFEYAAGGFADFTRIASSSPQMWTDIVCANEPALLESLDAYIEKLSTLRTAIAEDDRDTLRSCFERAKAARDQFAERSLARPKG